MSYQTLADAAVVLHFGFLVFLVVGGFVALRWRAVAWVHLAAVAWSIGIVTVGQRCPLTSLERWATVRAGGQAHAAGFIDRYVKGVVYPASLTDLVRVGVAVVVVVSWVLLWRARPIAQGPAPGAQAADASAADPRVSPWLVEQAHRRVGRTGGSTGRRRPGRPAPRRPRRG